MTLSYFLISPVTILIVAIVLVFLENLSQEKAL